MTDKSLPQIGALFGGRDHSTILHSCNEIDKRVKSSPELARQVSDLRDIIAGQ